tara:strand:+ start:261 stop:701 length:441 start_codon:yes stop_codon:yes gene_type:complete
MDRDRLERTADHLDTVSSREDVSFNMQNFLSKTPDCGTSACAIGFLINDKVFSDLIAIPDSARTGVVGETNYLPFYNDGTLRSEQVPHDVWHSISKFFDLSYEDLDYLFEAEAYSEGDPDWGPDCIRAKDVSERIRALLKREKKLL